MESWLKQRNEYADSSHSDHHMHESHHMHMNMAGMATPKQLNDLSNSKMLKSSLFSCTPASKATFHPVPIVGTSSAAESAELFEGIIRKICIGNPPVFDLIVLGAGSGGLAAAKRAATYGAKVAIIEGA